MGSLPGGPLEARFAATLFLLLLGLANFFGAWQVRQFVTFTPAGVASAVGSTSQEHHGERPIDIESLNEPSPHLDRQLLVQASHVHPPTR